MPVLRTGGVSRYPQLLEDYRNISRWAAEAQIQQANRQNAVLRDAIGQAGQGVANVTNAMNRVNLGRLAQQNDLEQLAARHAYNLAGARERMALETVGVPYDQLVEMVGGTENIPAYLEQRAQDRALFDMNLDLNRQSILQQERAQQEFDVRNKLAQQKFSREMEAAGYTQGYTPRQKREMADLMNDIIDLQVDDSIADTDKEPALQRMYQRYRQVSKPVWMARTAGPPPTFESLTKQGAIIRDPQYPINWVRQSDGSYKPYDVKIDNATGGSDGVQQRLRTARTPQQRTQAFLDTTVPAPDGRRYQYDDGEWKPVDGWYEGGTDAPLYRQLGMDKDEYTKLYTKLYADGFKALTVKKDDLSVEPPTPDQVHDYVTRQLKQASESITGQPGSVAPQTTKQDPLGRVKLLGQQRGNPQAITQATRGIVNRLGLGERLRGGGPQWSEVEIKALTDNGLDPNMSPSDQNVQRAKQILSGVGDMGTETVDVLKVKWARSVLQRYKALRNYQNAR